MYGATGSVYRIKKIIINKKNNEIKINK